MLSVLDTRLDSYVEANPNPRKLRLSVVIVTQQSISAVIMDLDLDRTESKYTNKT